MLEDARRDRFIALGIRRTLSSFVSASDARALVDGADNDDDEVAAVRRLAAALGVSDLV